ncbi:MAG: hypothetical protein IJQ58_09125 [Synergistaceae bacterium]|nr:hypothetical protein [Synergistaceae bacterium]
MARTEEEREDIRERFFKRLDETRGEVDTSDIPEVTDFSHFVPGKPYVDRIRAHNLKVYEERRKRQQALEQPILTK